ncbi:MAG: chemotaxis protein CheW [Gammaproteobacteria bacterium]
MNDVAAIAITSMPEDTKPKERSEEPLVYGSFHLGPHELALPADRLHDVVNPPESFTQQPLAPDYLMGIMTLRDMTIPVLDLRTMLDIADERPDPESMKIAIVEYGDHNIGMLFDDTGEVFRADRLQEQFTDYVTASTAGIIRGAFRLDDGARMIQVVDAQAIIEYDGAPVLQELSAETARSRARPPSRGPRHKSISFHLSGTELGINIHSVREIRTLGEVDTGLSADEVFLGTTTLRGEPMALIDLAVVLGLRGGLSDKELNQDERHVVVVEGGNQLSGLVVDDISDITQFYNDEMSSFPVFAENMPEIFLGCVSNRIGHDVLQIDVLKLLELPSIQHAIARCGNIFESGDNGRTTAKSIETRATYLTFRLEQTYGVPILEVAEVVDYPNDMLKPPLLNSCVEGILDLRGELIKVINARRLYDMAEPSVDSQQIIIFDRDDERFGIAIDNVESIATVHASSGRPLPDTDHHRGNIINQDVREAICFVPKDSEKLRDLLSLDLDAVAERIRETGAPPLPLPLPPKTVELHAVE